MDVAVSSREAPQKRSLITLDLLGGCSTLSSEHLVAASNSSLDCRSDFHPLDLNLTPEDRPKPAVAALAGSQSVCTIEKVKWALERVEHETRGKETEQRRGLAESGGGGRGGGGGGKGSHSPSPSSSSSSSITTASGKRRVDAEDGFDGCDSGGSDGSLVAAGCPGCLSYVLISKANPRCPRCDSQVALPRPAAVATPQKRPRIDLNFALGPL